MEQMFLHTVPCCSGPVFCPVSRLRNEAVFPPVRCSPTCCAYVKCNMIMRVGIEATERHSDQHWCSLLGVGGPNCRCAPGWRTDSAQTPLTRLEAPLQCFNIDFEPNKNIPNHWEGAQGTCDSSRVVKGGRACVKVNFGVLDQHSETLGSWTRFRCIIYS